jgi:hypothetical protein
VGGRGRAAGGEAEQIRSEVRGLKPLALRRGAQAFVETQELEVLGAPIRDRQRGGQLKSVGAAQRMEPKGAQRPIPQRLAGRNVRPGFGRRAKRRGQLSGLLCRQLAGALAPVRPA